MPRYLEVFTQFKDSGNCSATITRFYYYPISDSETSFSLSPWNSGNTWCNTFHKGDYIRSNTGRNIDNFYYTSISWKVIISDYQPPSGAYPYQDSSGLQSQINTINQTLAKLQTDITSLKERVTNLENQPAADLSAYLKKADLVAQVGTNKNDIVTSLMAATTWAEIPITIDLANYITLSK